MVCSANAAKRIRADHNIIMPLDTSMMTYQHHLNPETTDEIEQKKEIICEAEPVKLETIETEPKNLDEKKLEKNFLTRW